MPPRLILLQTTHTVLQVIVAVDSHYSYTEFQVVGAVDCRDPSMMLDASRCWVDYCLVLGLIDTSVWHEFKMTMWMSLCLPHEGYLWPKTDDAVLNRISYSPIVISDANRSNKSINVTVSPQHPHARTVFVYASKCVASHYLRQSRIRWLIVNWPLIRHMVMEQCLLRHTMRTQTCISNNSHVMTSCCLFLSCPVPVFMC